MRKLLVFSTVLLAVILLPRVILAGFALANSDIKVQEVALKTATNILIDGEQLDYIVKWNNLTAAKLITQTQATETKGQYRVELKFNTVGVAKELVTINDQFTAIVSSLTMLPIKAEHNITEGPKILQTTSSYNQERHLVIVNNGRPIVIAPRTQDYATLFWAIRNVNFATGGEKLIAFSGSDRRTLLMQVVVGGHSTVNIAATEFAVRELLIKLPDADKNLSDRYQVRVWVTDDSARIPVLITAQPPFGTLRIELSQNSLIK